MSLLGWVKRLAALQAARLVAGCDQPAERAHPLRFEISVLSLERCNPGYQPISEESEPPTQAIPKSAKVGSH
jgi:hypothetical protein